MKGAPAYDACFIGLGYVGLSTAVVFASKGLDVLGLDVDESKVQMIAGGKPPFHEPKLKALLRRGLKSHNLRVTSNPSEANLAKVFFVSVGTPSQSDGSIDLSYLDKVLQTLGSILKQATDYRLVVIKSTVVPGTASGRVKRILEKISGRSCGLHFGLCSNPEFLSEGNAINETLHPDRIVIGAIDPISAAKLKQFYRRVYGKVSNLLVTNTETAEMTKYANNAFLATKVSYINTIANICQQTPGVDVETVARGIGLDNRIGQLFLRAGPGYGGSCFHKDLQALIRYSSEQGYDPVLLRSTESVNDLQAGRIIDETRELLGTLEKKRIAILGLAFKKNIDDVRESPSIRIIGGLLKEGAEIVAYDPMAMKNARKSVDTIEFADDPRKAIQGSDCCIVLTEWNEFKDLKAEHFKKLMRTPNVIDARRVYSPSDFREVNFRAIGLGPSQN